MADKQILSSALLGLHAYQRAQGRPTGKLSDAKGMRVRRPDQPVAPIRDMAVPQTTADETTVREKKVSMLKSLQAQSNAGLVKIRDVSSALDELLKSS